MITNRVLKYLKNLGLVIEIIIEIINLPKDFHTTYLYKLHTNHAQSYSCTNYILTTPRVIRVQTTY